jgi:Tfp pilus assembly protein PilV
MKKIRAFTLAEMLLAAIILTVGIIGILLVFINCMFLDDANRNLTVAVSHGQFAMEEIKDTAFANISNNYNNVTWNASAIAAKSLSALNNETMQFQVSGTTILTVIATVGWWDRGVRYKSLILETLITEP